MSATRKFFQSYFADPGAVHLQDLALDLATLESVNATAMSKGVTPDRGALVTLFAFAQAKGLPTPAIFQAKTEAADKRHKAQGFREEIPAIQQQTADEVRRLEAEIQATREGGAAMVLQRQSDAAASDARAAQLEGLLALIS